jgi:hypothetical protein
LKNPPETFRDYLPAALSDGHPTARIFFNHQHIMSSSSIGTPARPLGVDDAAAATSLLREIYSVNKMQRATGCANSRNPLRSVPKVCTLMERATRCAKPRGVPTGMNNHPWHTDKQNQIWFERLSEHIQQALNVIDSIGRGSVLSHDAQQPHPVLIDREGCRQAVHGPDFELIEFIAKRRGNPLCERQPESNGSRIGYLENGLPQIDGVKYYSLTQ